MKFTVENRSHTEPRYVDERLQHLVSFAALEQLSKKYTGITMEQGFYDNENVSVGRGGECLHFI